jgi:hypothetical protein
MRGYCSWMRGEGSGVWVKGHGSGMRRLVSRGWKVRVQGRGLGLRCEGLGVWFCGWRATVYGLGVSGHRLGMRDYCIGLRG